ncbi:monooxygenase [Daedalea quercina L-15889]|uniref:Monooxygenase n=1 Tax=Daedalea quercina L-15889 TaxID=1314783 RepID=A0A165LU34_9APHY|nr:monooxygenase [Daedalea quercina L-15889]
MSTHPVLVAGAGPAGLALALTLVQNGVSVHIINKAQSYHREQRGIGIQPRTLEVFNFLRVLPDVLQQGRLLQPMRVYKLPGGTEVATTMNISPIEEDTPLKPFNNGFQLEQYKTEAIFRSHLEKYGCSVEPATELVSFKQFEDHVEATVKKTTDGKETMETKSYRWLIGADGGKSSVRKQLGLSFEGSSTEEKIVLGEVYLEGLDTEYWHIWTRNDEGAPATVLLRPTGSGTSYFMISGKFDIDKVLLSHESIREAMWMVTERKDLNFGDIIHFTDYRPSVRMVNKFGEGRVFLAGDAAHVHTPRGGQGLNSSVQDAFNIGWKIALIEKGLASPSLLDTYTEERLPVIEFMINETVKISWQVAGKGHDMDSIKAAIQRRSYLKQFGINYRWSSIVHDEREPFRAEDGAKDPYGLENGETLRAGDRAPNAPGLVRVGMDADAQTTSFFDILRPTHHTALIFGEDSQRIASIVKGINACPQGTVVSVLILAATAAALPVDGVDVVLQDRGGIAYDGYRMTEGQTFAVIVRPDGFVGAVVSGEDETKGYFGRIFSGVRHAIVA